MLVWCWRRQSGVGDVCVVQEMLVCCWVHACIIGRNIDITLYIAGVQVDSMSTQSTAQSRTGSAMDDPFNQDSLGDTVIYLEKVGS